MNRDIIIYAIRHIESGKSYVGSTVGFLQRKNRHRSELNRGNHHCQYLQNAWHKYGASAFEFVVLEQFTNSSKRTIRELYWIQRCGTYNVFTSNPKGDNFSLSDASRKARKYLTHRKMQENPEFADSLRQRGNALAAAIKSPEGRKRASERIKLRWQDPSEAAKLLQGIINRWADPEAKTKQSIKMKQALADPKSREHRARKMREAWGDPKKSQRLRERLEKRWKDPDAKNRQSQKHKEIWADPIKRARRIDAIKAAAAKRSEKIAAYRRSKPEELTSRDTD